jgi:hypothetical protein
VNEIEIFGSSFEIWTGLDGQENGIDFGSGS